jgi:ABC-type uncharacterized transport system auxiliary subunit
MYHRTQTLFLCACLILLAQGCLSFKQPRTRVQHYTLEYASPELTGLRPLPVLLKVDRFSVAAAYNTTRIIYRDGSFNRDEYFYHKWRANPGDLVTDFLLRDLRNCGLFKGVLSYGSDAPYSFSTEGSVDEFVEWDGPNDWRAVLAITVALMAADEPDIAKRVLFQKTYRSEKSFTEKTPQGLARAMSAAMEVVSAAVIRDIYAALTQ